MDSLFAIVGQFIIQVIGTTGYLGIFFLMALESANIPIPSEIIMPFSGFLVSQNIFSFWLVVFWGALGNLAGSLASYALGYWGGRQFLVKLGRFVFLSLKEIERGEQWLEKYGSMVAFFSRLLPVVRTFISFPAGLLRMNLWRFSLYTFAGSFLWSAFLAYLGFFAGENWNFLESYFRRFDWFILLFLAMFLVWWVYKKRK